MTITDTNGRPYLDGEAVEIRREVEATTLAGIGRNVLPCCLCGLEILHGAIDGDERELARIFRSQRHLGVFWVPVRDEEHLAECFDPPPSTSRFWGDRHERASYKAWRQKLAARNRAGK